MSSTNSKNQNSILSGYDDDFKDFEETPSQKYLRELREKRGETSESDESEPLEGDYLGSESEDNETTTDFNKVIKKANEPQVNLAPMFRQIENSEESEISLVKGEQLVKNTCSEWIKKLEQVKQEYKEYEETGKTSKYINERINKIKERNENITDDEIKETLKNMFDDLVNKFEFTQIENRPLFINRDSAAVYAVRNSYNTLKYVSKYYKSRYTYERVVYNYVRPYVDIDFELKDFEDNEDKVFKITKTLNFVYSLITRFKDYNPHLTVLAIAEYKPELLTEQEQNKLIKTLNEYEGMLTFKNDVEEFHKVLSLHAYVNGVCFDTTEFCDFINDTIEGKDIPAFDSSVYKTKGSQQIFRPPYSGKGGQKPRPANPEILKYMDENEDKEKYIINNCVICAREGDVILQYTKQPKEETKPKQTKRKTQITTTDDESDIVVDANESISIFRFLTIDKKFKDAQEVFKNIDHWHFIGKLAWLFEGLPLTEDEFYEEILLMKPNLNIEKTKSKITYKQDFDNGFYKLLKIKGEVQEQANAIELTKPEERTPEEGELLNMYLEILFKLKLYVEKYEKNNFIEHDFYDIKNLKNKEGKFVSKKNKLRYNCFKTVADDDAIYFIKNGEILSYKNKEALSKDLKLNGKLTKEIYDSLVCFDNVAEFELMKLLKRYNELPKVEKCVDDLLKMIRATFKYEDDYKFYISWLANKITYKTTNDRSIICQNENETAYDALKTYITQILSPFIEVKTADIRNLNKNLNGSYLTGHLTVIEELPKDIKDIDAFINTLKSNSQSRTLDIEEKKEKPRKIKNRTDFIINTNYKAHKLFYNKANAEALSKRFRILTRQTINVSKWSDTLDKYNREDKDHFNAFKFYQYLYNNEELLAYYKQHCRDKSDIEKLYIEASIDDATDKIEIEFNEEEFIKDFKESYMDKNGYLRLKVLTDYLKRNNIFKDIRQATLKQELLMSKCLHVEGKFNKVSDEEIKNIYKKYFVYVEKEKIEITDIMEC